MTQCVDNHVTQTERARSNPNQAGYGSDGLRAWRTDPTSPLSYYLYDGDVPVVQLAGTGNVGQVSAVNTFGPNGLLNRYSESFADSAERFYAFDPMGNAAEVIAGSGQPTLAMSACYDASGNRTVTPETDQTDDYSSFGAQWGYFLDIDSGFELLGHRYYDPAAGRFLTRDPIGYAGGVNLYGYADGNPGNEIDPDGMIPGGPSSDPEGDELFRTWEYGNTAPAFDVVHTDWGPYVEANAGLAADAAGYLATDISDMSEHHLRCMAVMEKDSAEMTPGDGGHWWDTTGYTLLHGTNSLYVSGTITLDQKGTYRYKLTYDWRDRIDPNSHYDAPMAGPAASAAYLGHGTDYNVDVTWSVTGAYRATGATGSWPFVSWRSH
jgi:RHS repeat-associated protein